MEQPGRGTHPDLSDKPHEAMPTTPQGAALGETVKAGLDRAGTLARDAADKTRDTLADYLDGRVEQLSDDIVKYVRSQPMTALLIGAGVGLFVGMTLVLARRPESV
jgi:ElaB/YqjD/DUF883 family membrane-anchored ribosome-binding protein